MENHNLKNNSRLRRILRLWWIWVTVGFAVLVALILISIPFGMDYQIESYFLANGADQADLEDVDFNPFTRRLTVKNLAVEVDNEQVLNVSEAGFTLSWSAFFKKRFLLEKIDLNNSTIVMEELPDGRWRIGGLSPAPSEAKPSASSWGFGLTELQIQNGLVKFRSSQLTSELSVEQARLTRLRTWRPDQNARFELKGQLNDCGLQFQGDLSLFGGGTTFEGSVKLNGLTITPFAQLMATDPGFLRGRLDADVRIQTQYSSKEGLNFSQSGRLALKQARMRFGDVTLADENFTWDGTVQVKLPAASDELHISVTGKLEANEGAVNPAADTLLFQHSGMNWDGKFVMAQKPETADFTMEGELKVREFKMATADLNLVEENVTWDGIVQIKVPSSAETTFVSATGQMQAKNATLDSNSENLKLHDSGLNWNGKFIFTQKPESTDLNFNGELKLNELEMATSNVNLAEKNLSWNGDLELLLPENSAAQRLTTDGSLESRRQRIVLVRENLNLTNEDLSWKGRFNCGLKDFTAGLNAEGDVSLTELVITATQKKLRLLASKAINLQAIKGAADTQFSVAAAKITGLDLVGQTDAPKESSLFSSSEVQVDTIKIERFKKVSIESVRIVAAKGVLHHKNDGRWRYIEDLAAFLADSRSSAKKNHRQTGWRKKLSPLQRKLMFSPESKSGACKLSETVWCIMKMKPSARPSASTCV